MNTKYMFIVTAMAMMLVSATALAPEDAFADKKKKYGKSQAIAQANECGNGVMAMNIGCHNTASQFQGDDNGAASSSAQDFDD
jgi:hypothetical protein